MAYSVKLTSRAEEDAYAVYERIQEDSPERAERWLRELFRVISSLDEMPLRCSLIPEAQEIGQDLRHLLYGKRSGIYRIIFDVRQDSEDGPQVLVLRIWHGARDRIRVEDLDDEQI